MENKKNKTKGIWIPEEIMVDKKLDWTNKALLSEIYSLCKLPDGCIASDNHFGKLLGIGRSSVNKRVNKLEELGYFTSENINKGKLCIGRIITKGSSFKKHTLVPEAENGSSDTKQEVVLKVDERSSVENTINTPTNSFSLIQETIQYTGETKISGITMNQFYTQRYEEIVNELVNKSSLGEKIFDYTFPENLDMFKYSVDENEYKIIFPLLTELIKIEKYI
ncbi:hypothetical protein [Aquirufa rosea]|uniref:Helix-turn-helix domain-containing protein n=1 Tax=Aquirufa rosea TaxID=2509241 RepID=A0A4Q1BZ99_9BACT|nr:hypothetical protein [Aquirufa rosea]RXK48857.1 hypothetical protein ESB04_07845 [Aquirufa rosea]